MLKQALNLKKKKRRTDREINTPLYFLRCVQIGLKLADLDALDYGFVIDLFTESENDNCKYQQVASQADFDKF